MLGTDFYVFLLAMVLAIVLLFLMVWHVSQLASCPGSRVALEQ